MSVDRRRFIQLGAMTVVSASACGGRSCDHGSAAKPNPPAGSSADVLTIRFKGLYIVEHDAASVTIHVVDAPAVGMPPHFGQLQALASQIDQSLTAKPDPSHVVPQGTDEMWLWDLKGVAVSTPKSTNGTDDLTPPPASATEDGQDAPSTDAGWNSLHRLPDLKASCGATKIAHPEMIASSISLTHGRVRVLKPDDKIGTGAVWTFAKPTGQQLFRGALSSDVEYTCPTDGKSLAITVGTQSIVFKPASALVVMDNTPLVKAAKCLADRGITGLWLIGLWERSIASQTIKRLRGHHGDRDHARRRPRGRR